MHFLKSLASILWAAAVTALPASDVPATLTQADIVRIGYHLDSIKETLAEWSGTFSMFQASEASLDLFSVRGLTTSRAVPTSDGTIEIHEWEALFYYKLHTHEVASTFTSPFNGQTRPITPTRHDSVVTAFRSTNFLTYSSSNSTGVKVHTRTFVLNLPNPDDKRLNVTSIDFTSYAFSVANLQKSKSLTNINILRLKSSLKISFLPVPQGILYSLQFVMSGKKVSSEGLSEDLRDEIKKWNLLVYLHAPISPVRV